MEQPGDPQTLTSCTVGKGKQNPVTFPVPGAVGMLRLAEALWARGAAVEASQALPLYLRDKVAETTAERAARVPA